MAESTKRLVEEVESITKCSVCMDMMVDPKSLPCLHSFCLKCLENYGQVRQQNIKVPCPMCRREFIVPYGGFEKLPNSFVCSQLIEVQRSNLNVKEFVEDKVCDQHQNETIKFFCEDCIVLCCPSCLVEQHKLHNFCKVDNVIDEMKSRIKLEMNELNRLIFDALDGMRYVEIRCKDITRNFLQIETEIRKREEDLKELLIDQTNALIAEVNDHKLELLKRYEMVMQDFQNQKEHWESLISMSLNGLDRGSCSELTRIAKDISVKTRSFVRRPLKLGRHEPISFLSEGQPDFKIGTIKGRTKSLC